MNETENRPPKKRVLKIVLLAALAVLLVAGAVALVYLHRWRSGQWKPGPALKQTLLEVTNTDELYRRAKALKADLLDLGEDLKRQDIPNARQTRGRMLQDLAALREEMDRPALAALGGELREELQGAEELMSILEEADESLLVPALALLEEQPPSGWAAEGGVRVEALRPYLDFAEGALPQAEALLARVDGVDLRLLDSDGKLEAAKKKLAPWRRSCRELEGWLPAVRAVLGDGGDRLYLFAAQNSAEIRASGGFPGAVGLIRISDGVLTVSDFESVYNLFARDTPWRARISETEDRLFETRMHLTWDSDFSPDFERAASIWAMAYEGRHTERVDGVISCTPAVIPRLLEVLGEVELSDGTVLNGENAGRVLGHDLYFNYLGAIPKPNGALQVDALFAEAARSTLQLLFSHLEADTVMKLAGVFRDSVGDRTLLVWMADEQEQAQIRAAGWDGGLNRDESKPAAGIFFNSTDASKMAWFLDVEAALSDPETNEDGTQSYTLTLTLSNTMTPEDLQAAGGYILGNGRGAILGSLYLFAPAGGSIDEAFLDDGTALRTAEYEGLALVWLPQLHIGQQPVTVSCRITTASGAAPLTLMQTPTMQAFR